MAPPPDQTYQDEEALPTYADGLEAYEDETVAWPVTGREQRAFREQGFYSPQQLDRWAWLMRRGVTEY